MTGRLHNFWDDCVFHVDYRTGLTKDWTRDRVATVTGTVRTQRGSSGLCLNFPNNTGYLTYGTDYTGFPDGVESRTVCGLVEFYDVENLRIIFDYGNNVAWEEFGLSSTGSAYNYKLAGIYRRTGLEEIGPSNLSLYYETRPVYVIVSYNVTTGDLKLFANGINQGTPANTSSYITNLVDPITVGARVGDYGNKFLGNIYTATLFNRELSEEEVRIHTKEICNNPRFLMQGR